MNDYVNLADFQSYLNLGSADTADNEALLSLITKASRRVDTYANRKFYPRLETRFYDQPKSSKLLKLDEELLELRTFKTQNGACTVASGVMWLGTGDQWNRPPYDRIVLDESSGSTLYYSGTPQRSQEVTGFWGYHEDWSNAWTDTGTSLTANYLASAGSVSLAGAGSYGTQASDVNGNAPRIAVGDTLRIGDQFFSVLGGAASGNGTVNVKPYLNGTSGASAASGASIGRFSPEPDIRTATIRLAAWMYGQRDAPFTRRQVNFQLGQFEIDDSMPPDVKQMLDKYKRRTIAVYPSVR